eukprot:2796113-Amphidinium_carterae.1
MEPLGNRSSRLERRSTSRRLQLRTRSYYDETKNRSMKPFGLEETLLSDYYWSTHYPITGVWKAANENHSSTTKGPAVRQDPTTTGDIDRRRSPALPNTKTTSTTPEWHFSPPDQTPFDPAQRTPKFPKQPPPHSTVQPPPGLPQPVETTPEPTLPTTTETDEEKKEETTVAQPPQLAPQVRRRLTTKTTPAKNDLLATIDTGVLHLSTNEDLEEKKLSLENMHLQE